MVTFSKDKNEIGTIVLDNPDSSANIINDKFIAKFSDIVKAAWADKALKGLIITSAKKDFMAGGDLEYILSIEKVADALKMIHSLHQCFLALENSGRPVVAALAGSALGGGLELALACHHRIALKSEKIQLGLPEVTLGLLPSGGGTQRLPRFIGIQPALEMATTGNKVNPEKALKIGLIHATAESPDQLLQMARDFILKTPVAQQPWADKKFKIPGGGVQSPAAYQVFAASNAMAAEKTYNNYPAPKAILSCIYEGLQVPFESALQIESRYFAQLATGPVAKNMIRTLFFGINNCNKGAARPKDLPFAPTKKVGVLGAGMMGAGIAYASAKAGIAVVLKDISKAAADKGKDYSVKICDGLIAKGRMTDTQKTELLSKIVTSEDPKAVADCDLIIETVIEDRKIKATVTKESEAVAAKTLVMASNTSTLPITGLADASVRPDRFIGLHFFSPVDKMPLVEIILGKKSGPEAVAKCMDYVQQIKKTPIVVNDGRGFYTSRIFTLYIAEGIALLKEGVHPALIENAGKMAGMPVGPLAVADEVSMDLIYHIMKQTVEDLGKEHVDQVCYEVSKLFVENLKRLGRKSGGGFYEYPKEGKKFLWPKLAELFKPAAVQHDVKEIENRFLTVQAIDSLRCLEEGILQSTRDGDVGSILGWGFPAYTGGTLSYIDFVGAKEFLARCEKYAKAYGKRFEPNKLLRDKAARNERVVS